MEHSSCAGNEIETQSIRWRSMPGDTERLVYRGVLLGRDNDARAGRAERIDTTPPHGRGGAIQFCDGLDGPAGIRTRVGERGDLLNLIFGTDCNRGHPG